MLENNNLIRRSWHWVQISAARAQFTGITQDDVVQTDETANGHKGLSVIMGFKSLECKHDRCRKILYFT